MEPFSYLDGACMLRHGSTEKVPGMFGTLVVCLPSPHEGGDVNAKLGKLEKVFKTSNMQPSWAC